MQCNFKNKIIGLSILFSVLFSVFSVSSSYAIDDLSVTFDYNSTPVPANSDLFPTCTDNPCLSQYKYLKVLNTDNSGSYQGQIATQTGSGYSYFSTRGYVIYDISRITVNYMRLVNQLTPSTFLSQSGQLTFTLTNTLDPSCQGGGGSVDTSDITTAIYTLGATILVIYFFFCIYQIIIKNGGKA